MIKKITLLFFVLTASFAFAQFPEDFSTFVGSTPPSGWVTYRGANGLGVNEDWKRAGTDPVAYAQVKYEAVTAGQVAEDWLVTPQFTVDATSYILSFDNVVFNTPDYESILTVRVSTGSQTTIADFTIVDTQTETDIRNGATTAYFTNHLVDLNAYVGQTVYIAFVWAQNDGDYLAIDNVNMIPDYDAPELAINLSPADGATDVVVYGGDADADGNADNSVTLSWDPNPSGDPATSYKLFIGTDPASLSLGGTFSGTNVTWGGRAFSTTYYWQVVPTNGGGDATGAPILSFTTAATAAIQQESLDLFTVYPNPAKDRLNLRTDKQITSLSIVNQLGQVVYKQIETTSNSIDISNLKKGFYIINVEAEGQSQALKFVKE